MTLFSKDTLNWVFFWVTFFPTANENQTYLSVNPTSQIDYEYVNLLLATATSKIWKKFS